MATNQQFSEEQLRAARKPLWHQAGEPVLTAEAAAEFIEQFGLVPFAPARLGVVAPTLVEATLGAEKDSPSAGDATVARDLLARLTADGAALPLNLLGGGGETPDFVVSGAAFRFVFTLRGDKSWKQPPATTGAAKVSPLALRVFETLTERGALTAQELAAELGREVTEAAIVRALNELWQMLRVIPLLQQGDGPTLWELTSRRFTRSIKAGVNAGQPTALSALISLYLKQAIAATGEDVETFLSPLTARSRVREVLRALVAARELDEVVVNGKTLLHVSGELPEFGEAAASGEAEADVDAGNAVAPVAQSAREEWGSRYSETETPEPGRIRRFEGREAPRTREAGNVAFKRTPREDRERRPFAREKREYTKPWDEERKPRPRASEGGDRPKKAFGEKRESGARGPRREFGARKPFAPREGGARKPFAPRDGERKPFRPRTEGDRPQRSFGGDRERKPFARRETREGGEDRPFRPRKPFDGERPQRAFGGDRERKPFARREPREGGEDRPFRPRKPFDGERPQRSFGGDRARKPFARREPREGGEDRPFRARKPFGGDRAPRKPFARREEGEAGGRPARKPFAAKKSFGSKPAGRFGGPKKFTGGAKGKPGAGKPGGFRPTSRKPKRESEE